MLGVIERRRRKIKGQKSSRKTVPKYKRIIIIKKMVMVIEEREREKCGSIASCSKMYLCYGGACKSEKKRQILWQMFLQNNSPLSVVVFVIMILALFAFAAMLRL